MEIGIGSSWESTRGRRTIVQMGPHPVTGQLTYVVTIGDSHIGDMISSTNIAAEIDRDQRNYEKRAQVLAKETAKSKLLTEHDDWYGFVGGLRLPTARSKALAALNKTVSISNQIGERGALIKSLIDRGYVVANDSSESRMFSTNRKVSPGRILLGPNGSYYTEKDLTKTGLDFASYLSSEYQP